VEIHALLDRDVKIVNTTIMDIVLGGVRLSEMTIIVTNGRRLKGRKQNEHNLEKTK
jgi:hypothetical protein